MSKGIGVILLFFGISSVYFRGQVIGYIGGGGGPDYALWIGILLAVVGLAMILFSRPKQPQSFR